MPAPKNPLPSHRLPSLLEAASQRIRLAARAAVERTIESLGLAALAAANVFQRDSLLGAQFELNRKSAVFALAFNDAFDQRLLRESAPRESHSGRTNWEDLSLVEDREIERNVAAERFGLEVVHTCEWELRELEAYLSSLLGARFDPNPLRPEAVGLAMIRGVEAISDRGDVQDVLLAELGRATAAQMRPTYQAIIADLRSAGVQPAGLTVRSQAEFGRYSSGYDTLDRLSLRDERIGDYTPEAPLDAARFGSSGRAHDQRGRSSQYGTPSMSGASAMRTRSFGQIDAQLMSLIRRLAYVEPGLDPSSRWNDSAISRGAGASGMMPGNLIRAHRDELRSASSGALDHMVIDLIGSLFDQILSDPKVPPQMARQIGRLQLPVLRAALGDPTFFSSRRHPVRRFVNRIASLGAAVEDFNSDGGRRLLERVQSLVQDVVEGDFEQIDIYENKLGELEQFIAELGREAVDADNDTALVLAEKETMLRVQHHYAQQLQAELKGVEGPAFVREFLTGVWSQVLVQAAQRHGAGSEAVSRLRTCARELFMSVQPKGTPAHRKEFLLQLPRMMQTLNEGMDLIHWPESARKAFFGLLLPAHAESLKGEAMRTLDYNMLARRVDGAFGTPLPTPDALPPASKDMPLPESAAVDPHFSAEEAKRIGLLEEAQVDWAGKVDVDLSEGTPVTPQDIKVPGMPAPDAPEPTHGKALTEHLQLGVAYQMHIDGAWQKVKLSHISPARTFYVFTRGTRHQKTISLTHRMLERLCAGERLRAFEPANLLERATARARRQLSALGPA